jgi:hypothetical protein
LQNTRVNALLASAFPTRTLFRGPIAAGQIVSRVDERDVAESLWKVPHLTPRAWIILLGQQSDIVPKRQQTLKHRPRFIDAALQYQIVDKPKTTGEECGLAWWQAVLCLAGVVAKDKAIYQQPALNCPHGAYDPRIGWRQYIKRPGSSVP